MFTPAVFYDLSGKYFSSPHHNNRITLTIFNSLSGKYINFLTSSTMTASALLSSLSSMMAETTFLSSFVKTLMFGDWNQRCVWNHWIFVFLKSILICWPHLAHQASCQQIGEVCWRSMLNFHVAVKPAYCKTFEIAPMTFSRHMSCANKRSPLSVSPGVGNQAITEETGDGGCSCPRLRCHPTADDLKTWRET